MNERKNLDKLFQEKFKDFEATTPEESWLYIEEKLKEKKKRRVIPIWWKLSGVAAVLLIGFGLWNTWQQPSSENPSPSVTLINQDAQGDSNLPTETTDSIQTAIATSEKTQRIEGNNSVNTTSGDINNISTPNSRVTVNANPSENKDRIAFKKNISIKKQPKANDNHYDKEQPLVSNNGLSSNTYNKVSNKNNIVKNYQNAIHRSEQQLAETSAKATNTKSSHLKASKVNNDSLQNTKINIKSQSNSISVENKDSQIAQLLLNSNAQPTKDKQMAGVLNPTQHVQIANNDIINPDKKQEKKLDSTAIATVVPNALEELLREKENNLVTKEPQINRWQITSSVAPIYFGSTSSGSPIDSTFASNSKSYKTNMSVKLGVNYAVNKKFTIRAGVSQITLDYNTKDVYVYAGMQNNSLANVDTPAENQFLHFARQAPNRSAALQSSIATNLTTDEFASEINQRMGYLEVPVEVSYTVIDKKIGLNVIGGVSTLFLNENKILMLSDGLTTNLGEANNLNKTHFSTNVGLGLRYRFFKAFQANFEPMFKYQINTFTKDAGNFKPYYLGLYTGISYSF